ncbi:MAG: YhcH/YjgK/YiaL family protein [Sphaerochaetaceae bacterium]|nr:YhcH/YjgK/YiaL family protein [Sphaerochaetaceae bacterium]
MLFDTLDNLELYIPVLPKLKKVIEVMDRSLPYDAEPGAYTTDDPDVRYVVSAYMTSAEPKRFESHRKETDVQIVLEGQELMALTWRELADQASPYDPDNDCVFLDGDPTVVIQATIGRFAIFLPGEPHKSGVALGDPSAVKKVVFKIKD